MDSDAEIGSAAPEDHDPAQRRACDQCRIRKVRCDKDSPCSNCRVAHRTCSSTGAGQKPKQPGQRVLISTQYERKIDLIEERLGSIEELLRALPARLSHHDEQRPQLRTPSTSVPPSIPASFPVSVSASISASHAASIAADTAAATTRAESDAGSAFEGDSSLTAQSLFASEFLHKAVERTSLRDASPNMHAALSSLRQIVAMQNKQSSSAHELPFPNQRAMPPGGLSELPMPPMPVAVSLLRHLKDSPPGIFSIVCCFMTAEDFAERCRKVYFCTEEVSDTTFIIVNAGLYYLFIEQGYLTVDPASQQQIRGYQQLCMTNLDTTLARLPLLLPARAESIEALVLGALYAVDLSKPSLAWHLICNAGQLCQTLGYHRVTGPKADGPGTIDSKALLFWHVYVLDKGLSLRLGRASILQDWDITIPRQVDDSVLSGPWARIITTWIRHADIQSRTYEMLYSPRAMSKPRAELAECARLLGQELKDLAAEALNVRTEAAIIFKAMNASQLLDMHLKGDEITFYTTLTLVYRAIPATEGSPSSFCGDCIGAARLAMQTHGECMELMGSNAYFQAIYIHWAILLTPFAPFFVLFCHVIESSSSEDMGRLQAFVTSLLPACPLSESIEKLHRLCQVLYSVATLYLEAKTQQQSDQNLVPIGDEFDMYLSALGLMPADGQGPGDVGGDAGMGASGDTSQLADWFSGNRYMMELLEHDMAQFNSMEWM